MGDLALYLKMSERFDKLEEMIMTAKEDVAAIVTQLSKALTELSNAIESGTVTQADLQPLRDVAQSLDNIVADAPPEEPPAES